MIIAQSRSLGLAPVDDVKVIKQAAEKTDFRVWTESTKDPGFIEIFTSEPLSRDHGPFWAKCRELQGAD